MIHRELTRREYFQTMTAAGLTTLAGREPVLRPFCIANNV